jgi:hypothetical protein
MATQRPSDFVFLLGDSRTGTTSIHRLFCELGFNSVHFYLKESDQIENSILNHDLNWQRLKSFICSSGFNAFADYPTRSFYRELVHWQPNARFIPCLSGCYPRIQHVVLTSLAWLKLFREDTLQ